MEPPVDCTPPVDDTPAVAPPVDAGEETDPVDDEELDCC